MDKKEKQRRDEREKMYGAWGLDFL